MQTIKLYDTAAIECIAGDTINGLTIDIQDDDGEFDPSAHTLECRISSKYAPTTNIQTVNFTATETGFSGTIPGAVTATLNGMHHLDFVLDAATEPAKILRVLLNVLKSPGGGS